MEYDLQSLRVSSADLPDPGRVEAFREIFGRTILRIEMEPLPGHALDVDMTLRGLPGFGIAAGTLSPMRNRHVAALADNDDLVLVALQSGAGHVAQCGREATINCGQAILTANGEAGTFTGHTETRLINFRLSRKLLAPLLEDSSAALIRPIAADTAALRLLVSYAGILNESEALATPELRRAVVNHMHDLAALALGGTRDATEAAGPRGVRAARLRAIKADVRASFGSRELSVSTVSTRHGVTPRYVQMLFEGEGTTFSEFVLAERLARAHRMLTNPRYLHLKVSEIAYITGFSELSYFNRAFRRRFGDTPSGVRPAWESS
jgi:AraC-like DNA-binding protein